MFKPSMTLALSAVLVLAGCASSETTETESGSAINGDPASALAEDDAGRSAYRPELRAALLAWYRAAPAGAFSRVDAFESNLLWGLPLSGGAQAFESYPESHTPAGEALLGALERTGFAPIVLTVQRPTGSTSEIVFYSKNTETPKAEALLRCRDVAPGAGPETAQCDAP